MFDSSVFLLAAEAAAVAAALAAALAAVAAALRSSNRSQPGVVKVPSDDQRNRRIRRSG